MHRTRRAYAALVPALAIALLLGGCTRKPIATKAPLPKAPAGAALVWPVPADVAGHIQAAGLVALGKEHEEYHLHVHLEVYKQDRQVVVPANIGVAWDGTFMAALHTHQNTGVVHVEAPTKADFKLWQLFTLWGVSLEGATAIIDDVPVPDPKEVVLADGMLITVMLGEN